MVAEQMGTRAEATSMPPAEAAAKGARLKEPSAEPVAT
jgi:hypothetical protein